MGKVSEVSCDGSHAVVCAGVQILSRYFGLHRGPRISCGTVGAQRDGMSDRILRVRIRCFVMLVRRIRRAGVRQRQSSLAG